jgi:hypothetical protein
MRRELYLFLFALCFIFSCKKLNQDKGEKIEQNQIFSKNEVVLLNSEHNKWLFENYGYQKWKPSENEIMILREIIDEAIMNNEFNFLKKPIKGSFNSYYKQYIPYVNDKGDRIITVNALCEIMKTPPSSKSESKTWSEIDWKNQYIAVDDGGSCYWEITINIDKKTYKNLVVN